MNSLVNFSSGISVNRLLNNRAQRNKRPFKRPFTRQKKLGPDPSKKRYGPITFVKKHWSFHRAIGAYGPVETPVFLYKSYGSVPLF